MSRVGPIYPTVFMDSGFRRDDGKAALAAPRCGAYGRLDLFLT